MTKVEVSLPEVSLSKETTEFLQRILGPVAEVSDLLSDKIRYFRWKSAFKVIQEAKKVAEEAGISAKEIPLKTLVPILEKSSLEPEDDEIIKVWARLLASASAEASLVHPSYPDVLSRLSANEVKMIDQMVSEKLVGKIDDLVKDGALWDVKIPLCFTMYVENSIDASFDRLCLSFSEIDKSDLANLDAANLRVTVDEYGGTKLANLSCQDLRSPINRFFSIQNFTNEFGSSSSVLVANGLLENRYRERTIDGFVIHAGFVAVTLLGFSLAQACQGPKGSRGAQ